MDRRWSIQLDDVPEGRVFHCTGCGGADFHPADTQRPLCRTCSPFTHVGKISDNGHIAAYSIYIHRKVTVISMANLEAELPNVDHRVWRSLNSYFIKMRGHAAAVSLIPDPDHKEPDIGENYDAVRMTIPHDLR